MQRLENWDDLRYLLAVSRSGTLAGAARALDVNQSTVMRRIAQLEDSLGSRLFDRLPRGYRLTAVGEDIVTWAARIEDDIMALDRSVLGADRELRGNVRVTTVEEILERIAPHLKSFHDQFPGITLEVDTDLRVLSLARREADVAIRPGAQPKEDEIVGRQLASLATAAYAAPAYLTNHKRPRRGSDLARHKVIDFGGHLTRVGTSKWLSRVAPKAEIVFRATSMSALQIAAVAGLGIAVLPCFMGDSHPGLERLFLVRESWDYSLWLLYHADLRQTARVRAFIDFIADAIADERGLYEGKRP